MKEQLVNRDTAQLAKEKGFDWECRFYWYTGDTGTNQDHFLEAIKSVYNEDLITTVPTQALLQRWLREKHNILAYLTWYDDKQTEPRWSIYVHLKSGYHRYINGDENYEKGLETGLIAGLKLI